MREFSGNVVSNGAVFGKIAVFGGDECVPEKRKVADTDKELARLNAALDEAKSELEGLYEEAIDKVGEENALIFDIHKMMLEDLDYTENIQNLINDDRLCAEYAVFETAKVL